MRYKTTEQTGRSISCMIAARLHTRRDCFQSVLMTSFMNRMPDNNVVPNGVAQQTMRASPLVSPKIVSITIDIIPKRIWSNAIKSSHLCFGASTLFKWRLMRIVAATTPHRVTSMNPRLRSKTMEESGGKWLIFNFHLICRLFKINSAPP
jgi:hypothetical protein